MRSRYVFPALLGVGVMYLAVASHASAFDLLDRMLGGAYYGSDYGSGCCEAKCGCEPVQKAVQKGCGPVQKGCEAVQKGCGPVQKGWGHGHNLMSGLFARRSLGCCDGCEAKCGCEPVQKAVQKGCGPVQKGCEAVQKGCGPVQKGWGHGHSLMSGLFARRSLGCCDGCEAKCGCEPSCGFGK